MGVHNLGENSRWTVLSSGTFVNQLTIGGTINGVVFAGDYEYHMGVFVGTVGNNGTLAMWGCTNSGGSSPVLIQSISFGSGSGVPAIEIKTDVLSSLAAGTQFPYITASGTVESGGTWRGALEILSTWPKNYGGSATTFGSYLAYGTAGLL
jgi:hypothetical protein